MFSLFAGLPRVGFREPCWSAVNSRVDQHYVRCVTFSKYFCFNDRFEHLRLRFLSQQKIMSLNHAHNTHFVLC